MMETCVFFSGFFCQMRKGIIMDLVKRAKHKNMQGIDVEDKKLFPIREIEISFIWKEFVKAQMLPIANKIRKSEPLLKIINFSGVVKLFLFFRLRR